MIISSFGGLSFFYFAAKNVVKEQSYNYLEAIANSKASHLKTFLNEQKMRAEVISRNPNIKDLLSISSIKDLNVTMINEELEEHLYKEFKVLNILDADGTIVASTNRELIGKDVSFNAGPIYNNKKGAFATFINSSNEDFFMFNFPLVNDRMKVIGILNIQIYLNSLSNITLDRAGLGESGEVYLINRDGYIITPLRFSTEFLGKKIDTENSRKCFLNKIKKLKKEEKVSLFKNYQNVNVIGTYEYIPEAEWCLLAEINEREAIGVLKDKLLLSAIIISIAISAIMVFFIFLSDYFIRKLIREIEDKKIREFEKTFERR